MHVQQRQRASNSRPFEPETNTLPLSQLRVRFCLRFISGDAAQLVECRLVIERLQVQTRIEHIVIASLVQSR